MGSQGKEGSFMTQLEEKVTEKIYKDPKRCQFFLAESTSTQKKNTLPETNSEFTPEN